MKKLMLCFAIVLIVSAFLMPLCPKCYTPVRCYEYTMRNGTHLVYWVCDKCNIMYFFNFNVNVEEVE